MTSDQREIRRKLRILEHAEATGKVAKTCRYFGIGRAAASMMIEQGWPAKKIQIILGHSSVTMTMDVYGHLFTKAEDDLALFEKLEQDLMAA